MSYDGLEDNDEFGDEEETCDFCGMIFLSRHYSGYVADPTPVQGCLDCRWIVCEECATMVAGGDLICPDCQLRQERSEQCSTQASSATTSTTSASKKPASGSAPVTHSNNSKTAVTMGGITKKTSTT